MPTVTPTLAYTDDGGNYYAYRGALPYSGSGTPIYYQMGIGGSSSGNSNTYFHMTHLAYSTCTGTISTSAVPGNANSYSWTLYWSKPAVGTSCIADVANQSHTTLCMMSGTSQKSCSFSVTPNMEADTCFQVVGSYSGAPPSGTVNIGMSCKAADGTGTVTWTQAASLSGGFDNYVGNYYKDTFTNSQTYWLMPRQYNSISGIVKLTTPPGSAKTWTVKLRESTSSPTSTQNCKDGSVSYADTTTLGTISGATDTQLTFDNTAVSIKPWRCYTIHLQPTGSTADSYVQIALHVATGSTPVGGGLFASGYENGFLSPTYYGGGYPTTSATDVQGYWMVPGTAYGLQTIRGAAYWMGNGSATAGCTISMKARYSTTALSTSQQCSDLSYTETAALCSFLSSGGSGGGSCGFGDTAFPAVAGGCWGWELVKTGSCTFPNSTIAWIVEADELAVATPTPITCISDAGCPPIYHCETPTPAPTPTVTPSPTRTVTP
jgi:hypothetical protein